MSRERGGSLLEEEGVGRHRVDARCEREAASRRRRPMESYGFTDAGRAQLQAAEPRLGTQNFTLVKEAKGH